VSVLVWLESVRFSAWVRESGSFWAYPAMQFLHTLGWPSRVPLPALARYYPLIWVGLAVSAASGLVLFVADATTLGTNFMFWGKLVLVAGGMIALTLIRRRFLDSGENAVRGGTPVSAMALLGVMSVIIWFGAIAAGRLTSYVGGVPGEPGLTNPIFSGRSR
jgi:hypothetical protein